ncbi:MAG: ExbD/TolR family protein [Bdellovibrionia bacterium]
MRRRYKIKTNQNSSFTLNITSMTDMFTMLLVFLLQTYSTAEVQLVPDDALRLPSSAAMTDVTSAVKISLSKTSLKFEEKELATLSDAKFSAQDIDASDSNFIRPLFEELDKLAKSPDAPQYVKDGKVLLQADRELPYSMLRKVMYTASMAGFPQLKLVTMAGE